MDALEAKFIHNGIEVVELIGRQIEACPPTLTWSRTPFSSAVIDGFKSPAFMMSIDLANEAKSISRARAKVAEAFDAYWANPEKV